MKTLGQRARRTKLTWKDGIDYPSLQLIDWVENTLPPGAYSCAMLLAHSCYLIRTLDGVAVATWPDQQLIRQYQANPPVTPAFEPPPEPAMTRSPLFGGENVLG